MPHGRRAGFAVAAAIVAAIAMFAGRAHSASNDPNAYPNPYRLIEGWAQLPPEIHAQESIHFSALVQTGSLTPQDLRVELYAGPLNADGDIINPIITEMQPVRQEKNGYLYEVKAVPCCGSGRHGYTARVLPRHPDARHLFALGVITWAG